MLIIMEVLRLTSMSIRYIYTFTDVFQAAVHLIDVSHYQTKPR